jgi:two-component system, NarL family, invasion response regulator UvrY
MDIIIVDDNPGFREDLKFFIEQKLNHKVIAEAESGEQFLEKYRNLYADIVLMDITMKMIDGFETTKKLLVYNPFMKVLAITMYIEKVYLVKLLESGFRGCIFKNELFTSLDQAIKEVCSGSLFFPESIELSGIETKESFEIKPHG